ncbi:MAG: sulfurtransferase TusA family protein [Alphaproteobacteria bacterium]|jgi:tRNA 2-thiouridine synthesizing protein A|nr:sulfurtransferase TusA family protein [Alphaproteobacteria bacterium]MBU2042605.1 sulfurtransferase TusA family protein [Alphaproteobacteria bacterium]MBU2124886.1 sulfurtransferase TusA family protein [Alphaproteobacteria bacterium]MBU2209657.1 sulfurtransferase TusA family protein [Alphaproteobacteria bacterium]MBU2291785.1 sulfurtransferase TusA family protein [Alphaproteobacteria bacterium]
MIIDARGHRCPTPSLKLQKAFHGAPPGTRLTLLATDPMARIDVPHLMAGLGGETVSINEDDGVLTIVVSTPAAPTG